MAAVTGKTKKSGLSYAEYRMELLERRHHPTDEGVAPFRANRPTA